MTERADNVNFSIAKEPKRTSKPKVKIGEALHLQVDNSNNAKKENFIAWTLNTLYFKDRVRLRIGPQVAATTK